MEDTDFAVGVLKGGCHMLSFAELGNSHMNKAPFSAPKSITSLEVRNSEKGERPRFAFESNHAWRHKRKGLEQIKITLLRVNFSVGFWVLLLALAGNMALWSAPNMRTSHIIDFPIRVISTRLANLLVRRAALRQAGLPEDLLRR